VPADAPALAAAAAALRAGPLVAFPTETVYGLGARASDPLAVRQIFAAKGRPVDHPLIVHLADAAEVDAWVDRARLADGGATLDALAARFWPGPLTLVVPRAVGVPDEVTGGMDTVGLRVPAHPLARALIAAAGGGLAAPSANRFGRVSPTTAAHVRAELGPDLLILDGGPCGVGVESTILDLCDPAGPALLRPGGLPAEALVAALAALGRPPLPLPAGRRRASGTLAAHYAPRTALRLSPDPEGEAAPLRAAGQRVATLRAEVDLAGYAQRLYAELRALDAAGVDLLIAELAPEEGLGVAINDRLRRAAVGAGDAS
jgi:L-threonylcarbamoyladenylate synthase